jgi:DNA-directed RNA polymerase specialized sigma24 family protein
MHSARWFRPHPILEEGLKPMPSKGSVSNLIIRLKAGDHEAVQRLWERYFQRLVVLARNRLQGIPRRAADEEDVALSVFDSFCRAMQRGRYPQLTDRDDLWRLLVVWTARKSLDLARREQTVKRGGGYSIAAVAGELDQIIDRGPTPEFAAQVAEHCQQLLDRLEDSQLRELAVWKMEGYTNEEIAAKLGCIARTVERRLRVIRSIWTDASNS